MVRPNITDTFKLNSLLAEFLKREYARLMCCVATPNYYDRMCHETLGRTIF